MSILPESFSERRKRMLDDQQQGATYHQHGVATADETSGGRYAKRDGAHSQIVGQAPAPSYPASALSNQPDAGPEPPLGYSLNDPEPARRFDKPRASRATGGAPSAPPGDDVAAPPPSSHDDGGDDAA